jgi:4'-phosphopantetheinyl transferase EntD
MNLFSPWSSPFPADIAFAVVRREFTSPTADRVFAQEQKSEKRRESFLRGRAAARIVLCSLGGTEWLLPSGSDGAPQWPPGVVGSLTHCQEVAVAAAARSSDYRSIGLDLEAVERMGQIDARLCRGREAEWVHAGEVNTRRTALFSAKETLFKLLYPVHKERFGLRDVELSYNERQHCFTLYADSRGYSERYSTLQITCQNDGEVVLTSAFLPSSG